MSITRAEWFGSPARPLLGWVTGEPGAGASTVVIAAPIGYEHCSSHRTLRTLAETLAARGHRVVRFDYDGTGDSSGERWDPERAGAWRRSLATIVARCRESGATRITIVGLRLGATFALVDGAQLGADAIVAWVPIASGKRFVRELRMMGVTTPSTDAVTYAGVGFDAETVAALSALDLDKLASKPASRVLVVARPEQPCDDLVCRLAALGVDVTSDAPPGVETMLDVPAEDAVVPLPIVERIAEWVGAAPQATLGVERVAATIARASIAWRGVALTESVETVAGLVAIESAPASPHGATVVFLNSGCEPHIGPGRAWVEYARALAAAGHSTLRLDWSGWGESVDRGHAPPRPYDAHCIDETVAVAQELRRRRSGPIVLAGLCAGAWAALRVAQLVEIDGVVAINPQLYWEPGDPVEALLGDTRKRRTASGERAAIAEGSASGRWDELDIAGDRPMASRWLDALGERETRVLMFFAKDDDGIEYLRLRCGRRLAASLAAGWLRVEEADDLDHQMYREWRRDHVASRIVDFLSAAFSSTTGSRPSATSPYWTRYLQSP